MMEYWVHSCSIWLKNNTVHGINKPIKSGKITFILSEDYAPPRNSYPLSYYDGKIVRFRYKDYAHGAKTSYMTLKVYTFIARLIRHIPDKHFAMIATKGWLSLASISTFMEKLSKLVPDLIRD